MFTCCATVNIVKVALTTFTAAVQFVNEQDHGDDDFEGLFGHEDALCVAPIYHPRSILKLKCVLGGGFTCMTVYAKKRFLMPKTVSGERCPMRQRCQATLQNPQMW